MKRGLVVLFVGILALGVFVAVRAGTSSSAPPADGPTGSEPAAPGKAPPDLHRPPLPPRPPPPPVQPQDVERRYTGEDLTRFRAMSESRQKREMAQMLEHEKVVLDPKATLDHRTQAFRELSAHGAVSRECASAMAALLSSNPERSSIRATLSASLRVRAELPEVQEALLTRLHTDPNEMVRKRAVHGLEPVNQDPRVRSSLQQALQKETSEFVRKEIQEVLQYHPGMK